MEVDKEALEWIGAGIIEVAKDRFEKCGAGNDFCIQSISGGRAVFGGTNRVIFDPLRLPTPWYPDAEYCTNDFFTEWRERYGV